MVPDQTFIRPQSIIFVFQRKKKWTNVNQWKINETLYFIVFLHLFRRSSPLLQLNIKQCKYTDSNWSAISDVYISFFLFEEENSNSRCWEGIWFRTTLYPGLANGHRHSRSGIVRPFHGHICVCHRPGLLVPPQPVPLAGPLPPRRVSPHQHEVVGVRPHKPRLVGVHRHVGLVVETTHVAQSHVGDPIPKS